MPGRARRFRTLLTLPVAGLFCLAGQVRAADADAPLEEIVVSGEFPGPGMWKVTRPDDSTHVLWIISELPPLPKRMKWKSREVEAVAHSAQDILLDRSLRMEPDEKIGLFRVPALLPAAVKAPKNPVQALL